LQINSIPLRYGYFIEPDTMDSEFSLRRLGVGGFSAIELLTVLVLVTVLASIAAPSMDAYVDRTRTQRALDQLVGDVAYARLLAVQEGRSTAVRLEANGTYRIERLDAGGSWVAIRTVDLAGLYRGVGFDLEGGTAAIEFSSRGLISNFGDSGAESFLKVSRASSRDSVFVSPAGRTYRAF
jgi:prepilin-type N-terminal cleavage/methylation domain-containing protein